MEATKELIPLIDGDILLHEIGHASETGWQAITNGRELVPSFDYVEKLLLARINNICGMIGTKKDPVIFMTEGRTFRYDVAKTKPYKGQRKDNKPWHFRNLFVYMRDVMGAKIIENIEADDAMAITQTKMQGKTIICSRDKDLRQVPGWTYSWELGKQPSFGPHLVEEAGSLKLDEDNNTLTGTGLLFFYSQLLTGDTVDNIPGCKGVGPVKAYNILTDEENEKPLYERVREEYERVYGDKHEDMLLEQGRLLWMVRRFNEDGSPQLYELGMEE